VVVLALPGVIVPTGRCFHRRCQEEKKEIDVERRSFLFFLKSAHFVLISVVICLAVAVAAAARCL